MSAHTLGPWIATQRPHTKGPPSPEESHLDYFHIMAGHGDDSWELTGFMRPSDARLIAAAPELYEVCREMLDWVHGHRPGRAVTDAITGRLVAAIAKAEGQS